MLSPGLTVDSWDEFEKLLYSMFKLKKVWMMRANTKLLKLAAESEKCEFKRQKIKLHISN